MRLAALQRAFAARILKGDPAILPHIRDSARAPRATLLHVYEHAYGARLAEVLEGDYEKLRQALGADGFLTLAAAYVEAYPSRHPNARFFGRHLPAFIEAVAPWSDRPWLAELARLEWAMGEGFVAEDQPRVGLEAMAALHPEDWPRLTFAFVEDLRRLETRHGGPEAWLALDASDDPALAAAAAAKAEADGPLPQRWLIWRMADKARFRSLEPPEAAALDLAASGGCFADLCEALLEFADAIDAATLMAGYLRTWIEAGVIAGYAAADGA